jgi:rod shape-determining protein MreB
MEAKNLVRVNGKVYLIHEPMAAAIGIGIDIMQPKAMIVDIGGGTTWCNCTWWNCLRQISKIAGDVFTNDIVYMRTHTTFCG